MDLLLVALAGMAAGFVNTVVGSGSLISFPTLVAFLLPSALQITHTISPARGALERRVLVGPLTIWRQLAYRTRLSCIVE